MEKLSCVLHCLVIVMIIVGLEACAGIGVQTDTSPTPTQVLVISLNQPGRVNADVVPVRRGPGVEYEQVGTLSRKREITVVGRSGDSKWYKVELPDYSGDQPSFWVAADFVTLIFSTETVTMSVETVTMTVVLSTASLTLFETITAQVLSPSPSATLQFPTSYCAVSEGWVPYIVQPGDTLFSLALNTNTTPDEIMRANCLTSNQIAAGSRLFLPFVPPTGTLISPPSPTFTDTAIIIQTPTPTDTATAIIIQTPTDTATTTPTQILRQTPTDTPEVRIAASSMPIPIHTPTATTTGTPDCSVIPWC